MACRIRISGSKTQDPTLPVTISRDANARGIESVVDKTQKPFSPKQFLSPTPVWDISLKTPSKQCLRHRKHDHLVPHADIMALRVVTQMNLSVCDFSSLFPPPPTHILPSHSGRDGVQSGLFLPQGSDSEIFL